MFKWLKHLLNRPRASRNAARPPAETHGPRPEVAEKATTGIDESIGDQGGDLILVTDSAYRAMIADAEAHPTVETGGILVGTGKQPVILGAGTGGENAVREPARFSSDLVHDRRFLDEVRSIWGESAVAIGYWHRHPNGMTRASSTDQDQASQLNQAWDDGAINLVAIVTKSGFKYKLYLYGIRRGENQLSPQAYRVVPDDADCVRNRLEQAVHYPPVCEDASYWMDAGFQSYETPIVRQRLSNDVAEIRRDFCADVVSYRGPDGRLLRLDIRMPDEETLTLIIPPEYPMNPPRVFVGGIDVTHTTGAEYWNSTCRLTDLLCGYFKTRESMLEAMP